MGLVVLVGVSGSGKSTFAARHFTPWQVISSDYCRGLVADDPNDQSATKDAFDVLQYLVGTRLRRGLLTVVDATSVQKPARLALVKLARDHDVMVDAIVLDVPERVASERNAVRPDRQFGAHVVARQHRDLKKSLRGIRKEGFRRVHVLSGVDEVEAATITTERPWNDRRDLTGPFDIVGDIHGCASELRTSSPSSAGSCRTTRPAARSARPTPRAAPPCSSVTSSTAARTRRACSGWSWAWSPRAPP